VVFGPLVVPFLLLPSQVANVVIKRLLPPTYRTSLAGNTLSISASSAQVSVHTTMTLDLAATVVAQGTGRFDVSRYTGFRLVDDTTYPSLPVDTQNAVDVKVDYDASAIEVQDGEIRLAANLGR